MGGNYKEGSWSCRLIGFFTSTKLDLSRPWAAKLHIWSWGQYKRGWGKKRMSRWRVPFDHKSLESYFCAASYCLWLERFPFARSRSLSSTLMASIIGAVFHSQDSLQKLLLQPLLILRNTKGRFEIELLTFDFEQIPECSPEETTNPPLWIWINYWTLNVWM